MQSLQFRFLFIFLLLIILLLAGLSFGSVNIAFQDIFSVISGEDGVSESTKMIIREIRFPRSWSAMLAGAGLAISGLMMQSLFRNPLAGPSVLGISSGASLGVALAVLGGLSLTTASFFNHFNIFLFAVLGATAVIFLIVAISFRLKDNASLLIAGLMIGYMVSAVVSVLQSTAGQGELQHYIFWGFAGFGDITLSELPFFTSVVVLGGAASLFLMKPLNALLMGEEYAVSLGVKVKSARIWTILICGLLVGSITAWCGPIAFIGIAIPHFARVVFKTTDHKILFPACLLIGMVAALVCDIISRAPWGGTPLPLNAITSMLGAPVIVWYIFKRSKMSRLF